MSFRSGARWWALHAPSAAIIATTFCVACAHDAVAPANADTAQSNALLTTTAAGVLLNATDFSSLDFSTYDGSDQVTHPAAVVFGSPWNGHRYWLALTPYPNSDVRYENPSLYAGETGSDWSVPAGVTNPLARTTRGYLSDPDLVYDPDADALRLYYREVVTTPGKHGHTTHVADNVLMTSSADGVHWSTPRSLVTDSGRYVVSPSILRNAAGDWRMWAVDAGTKGCDAGSTRVISRNSSNGTRWSRASTVGLVQPGFSAWHLDVQYVAARGEYWALVAAYARGRDCTSTSLFLATSRDGQTWTSYPSPVLARGLTAQFATNVYRSSFTVDDAGQNVTIWVTGAATARPGSKKRAAVLTWSAAVMRTSTDALLARVAALWLHPVPADSDSDGLRQLAHDNIVP